MTMMSCLQGCVRGVGMWMRVGIGVDVGIGVSINKMYENILLLMQ